MSKYDRDLDDEHIRRAEQRVTVHLPWDDPFLDALEPLLARFRYSRERELALLEQKIWRLSPDLETCEALYRGEKVPVSRMNPVWAKAYGY